MSDNWFDAYDMGTDYSNYDYGADYIDPYGSLYNELSYDYGTADYIDPYASLDNIGASYAADSGGGFFDTLGSIGNTLGGLLTNKTLLGALGLGASALGQTQTQTGKNTSGTSTGSSIQQQPLGPQGQEALNQMGGLCTLLAGQMTNPLNPAQADVYNNMVGNMGQYLNIFPEETWNRAESTLSQGAPARRAALEQELMNTYGMKMQGRGNVQSKIMEEVLNRETQEKMALANLLQSRAGAQQQATIAQPTQFSNMLGVAGYPQAQQQNLLPQLVNLLSNIANIERGGQPISMGQQGAMQSTTQNTQNDFLTNLLSGIGPALLQLAGK